MRTVRTLAVVGPVALLAAGAMAQTGDQNLR